MSASGATIYSYVGGNPVNAVDPLGLVTVYADLPEIEAHLRWLAEIQGDDFDRDDAWLENQVMLMRLALGLDTAADLAFAHHEAAEAKQCRTIREQNLKGQLSIEDALRAQLKIHYQVLEDQQNTSADLYHWSATVAAKLWIGVSP